MKIFLKKFLFYLILLIAGGLVADFILDNGLRKARMDEFSIWNDIFDSKINSDVIIQGGSRAWRHFNPEILDSVLNVNTCNLGMDYYLFSMQYVRFKLLEKYNKLPKLIIQNVDFITLFRRDKIIYKIQFLSDTREVLLKEELKKMGMSEAEFCIPAWKYHSEYSLIVRGVKEFFNDTPSDRVRKRYNSIDYTWNGNEFGKRPSNDSIVALKEPEIVELFDSFLNECKDKNIQVILVFSPQYIKVTEFTKNWNEEMQVYYDFSAKYNIPLLDYTHDSLCYDTAYFYNAMHLNKKGSELFSLKLANDIKEQNLYKH
jgi:hypothetical protein